MTNTEREAERLRDENHELARSAGPRPGRAFMPVL